MSNTTQLLPNPDTYLNHFAPDDATRLEVARIIHATFLGAIVWDILAFIPEDMKILRQGGSLITKICYLLARTTAAACAALWVVVESRPVSHCRAVMISIDICCLLTTATSSYLFLKRAQAIYAGNRSAQWGFLLLFICASSSTILPFFSLAMEHIPGTGFCTISKAELYGIATYLMTMIFDSLVFFAISYKIAYQSHQDSLNARGNWVSRLFTSKSLPLLSKAILHGGQKYYLVGLVGPLIAIILALTPSVPPRYRMVSMTPAMAVTAVMVCRVHRDMVLAFHNPGGDVTGYQTRDIDTKSVHFAQPVSGGTTPTVTVNSLSESMDPERKARVGGSPLGYAV